MPKLKNGKIFEEFNIKTLKRKENEENIKVDWCKKKTKKAWFAILFVINCCLYYRILIGIVSYTNSIMEFENFFLSSVPQFLWAQSTIKPNTHFYRQVQLENKFDLLKKVRPSKAYKRESLGRCTSLTRPWEIGPDLLQKAVGKEMGWEISLSLSQKKKNVYHAHQLF